MNRRALLNGIIIVGWGWTWLGSSMGKSIDGFVVNGSNTSG
jgi:hypothetical protein